MNDTTKRLNRMTARDHPRAFALISEAVWWVTIVDATLVRHHLAAYDRVMAGQTPPQRQLTEQTLAGLRFVRNRIGDEADLAEFIEPGEGGQGSGAGRITGWTWRPVPESKLASLAPHRRSWEMSRYHAYEAQLAGHTIGETFGRATAFLKLAVADAPSLSDASAHATPERAPSLGRHPSTGAVTTTFRRDRRDSPHWGRGWLAQSAPGAFGPGWESCWWAHAW
jgi:hypothetical protein